MKGYKMSVCKAIEVAINHLGFPYFKAQHQQQQPAGAEIKSK
jgi:hypothetical protein